MTLRQAFPMQTKSTRDFEVAGIPVLYRGRCYRRRKLGHVPGMRYLRAAFATVTPMRCLSLKSGMIRPQKQLRHPRGALLKKSLILRAEGVQLIALHIDE